MWVERKADQSAELMADDLVVMKVELMVDLSAEMKVDMLVVSSAVW